jgi:alpha-L-rhamnosidase
MVHLRIVRYTALACLTMMARGQQFDQLRRDFADPPKAARPMVRWWWPGGDVTPEELRREIGVLDAAGFAGAEIQPFRGGLKSDMPAATLARVNDYPTASFYSNVRAALEEARDRGLFLDLTLGSGWPFGGGEAITPELAASELRFTQKVVTGPARFRERIELPEPRATAGMFLSRMVGTSLALPPGWRERLQARTRVIAVLAAPAGTDPSTETVKGGLTGSQVVVKRSGKLDPRGVKVITAQLKPNKTLEWQVPEGSWRIFVFFQQPVETRVIGAVGAGPQLVLDHMNRAALAVHLSRISQAADPEIGAFYGKTLRAGFCDSLEVEGDIFWTDEFLKLFRQRRGYDLTPWLPFMSTPGRGDPYGAQLSAPWFDGPGADRIREDYWKTVSDLWIDNFFTPLVEWQHSKGILARVQPHGAPADILRAYGLADIPETEQLYAGGQMEFLKMASSAAHVYGRRLVSAEAFVHSGQAYKSTPESIERDTNRAIAAGINEIVYHGFPYVYMDRPEPGWHPFAAPASFSDHFNDHNTKIWPAVPGLNAYISRLQVVARGARPSARYALYWPGLDYPNRQGAIRKSIDYDYINDDALARSKVRNGRLIAPSGGEYEALILPTDRQDIRNRFPGLHILVGEVPADSAPTRWKAGASEFRFYFNDSDMPQEYPLTAGEYELWDAATGSITPFSANRVRLEPGKAQLLLEK